MSVYINGDKKGLRRTTNLPTSMSAFTACGFVKVVNAQPGQNPHIFFAQSTDGSAAETLYLQGAGALDLVAADAWGGTVSPTIATLTAGGTAGTNWRFVALRGTATGAGGLKGSHKPVGSGTLVHQTITNTPGAQGIAAIQLGDLPFGTTYWSDMLFAHWMIYSRALSDAELLTQSAQGTPASTTNLISYHSFSNSDINVAVVPDTGTGTFTFFNSAPTTSTDMPVFSADPIFNGSVNLPSTVPVVTSTGAVIPLVRNVFGRGF